MLRLLRLSARKPGLSSPFMRKPIDFLVWSPVPGGSTLMTSAPMSPSNMQQNGPAMTWLRSSTRKPVNGGRLSGAPVWLELSARSDIGSSQVQKGGAEPLPVVYSCIQDWCWSKIKGGNP